MEPARKSPRKVDEEYFRANYNTKLDKVEEKAFRDWVRMKSMQQRRDVMQDTYNYDLRGYWKSGGYTDTEGQKHGPDTFKKPNHQTFSNESMYHGTMSPYGEPWEGGKWGKNSYTPSKTMLKYTHDPVSMATYFRDHEPDVKLTFPKDR